ncbi:ABC transporter permease [Sphingomonas sinipercae]|uniref:ABC transporter permease n=1 Tax=Sphingomonas sinipercae TaxID=2714944 RepID=A0A6G7ZPT8_9SPHN|nr:ABC transporter permease [Sphingomonas sinipercae]QIL02945.1 ABC transporter permease [Sphingomonas sinipercae]
MKNILIIAAREFRQIASMRSFWLTLLILPVALAAGPLASRFLEDNEPDRVIIVDRTGGGEARSIQQRFAADQDRATLQKLSRYVRRHKLEQADPGAAWAAHDRWYSDADIAQFRSSGGLDAALAKIERVKAPDTPEFKDPDTRFEVVAAPVALAATPDERLDAAVQGYLKPAGKDARPIDYVLMIPRDFGASPVVRLWARSEARSDFVTAVQDVLTRDLRARFLQSQGVSATAAEAAGTIAPALSISTPPPGGGAREAMLVRSIVPLALCYLLMMSLMLSGSWMLQGTVEERSNKLLETVLACASPEQLMYGKLLGTIAVGLSMILFWALCAIGAAYMTHGAIADMIRPALEPLTSPGTILTMIYFFIVGYILHSIIFLAIGSMSESMREAQGYLMPVLLAVLLPITFLMQAIIAGGGGMMIKVLTWVPFWSPFAVLARLGTGIAAWEVIGSGLVLAAFTVLMIVMLGRLFRSSLLAQGQRPNLKEAIARMRRGDGEDRKPARAS